MDKGLWQRPSNVEDHVWARGRFVAGQSDSIGWRWLYRIRVVDVRLKSLGAVGVEAFRGGFLEEWRGVDGPLPSFSGRWGVEAD